MKVFFFCSSIVAMDELAYHRASLAYCDACIVPDGKSTTGIFELDENPLF
jgi:hypothetical protein